MDWVLNMERVKELAALRSIESQSELCELAGVHPNSLTPYAKGERSPITQVVTEVATVLGVSPISLIENNKQDSLVCDAQHKFEAILPADLALMLFGSRARKSARKYSDIDVGVTGGAKPISFSSYVKFQSQVEEQFENFSHTINLVNLDKAPQDFLLSIAPDLTFLCGSHTAAAFLQGYISGQKENKTTTRRS